MQQVLIHQVLLKKKPDLNKLKPIVDVLGIGKVKNVPSDTRKLVPVDLKKLSDIKKVIKKLLLKKMCMMNWLKKLIVFRLLILLI